MRLKKATVVLTVRADGPFFVGCAKVDDHTFVTSRMTTKVGAQVAALGLVAAHFASVAS